MSPRAIRRTAVAFMATGIVALTAACAPSGGATDEPSEAAGPYILGINAELSGPVSFYGTTIRDGIQAWADEVNADGGLNGHEVQLVILDNAGDAARAATNTTQLATSDKVSGVLGFSLSANCTASAVNAERYKVPQACLSVAEANDWVFSLGPSNLTLASGAVDAIKEVTELDEPKLAIAVNNTPTSNRLSDALAENAADAGIEVVAKEVFELASTDLSPTTSKIVASDPDVVFVSGTGPNFVNVQKGLRAAGLDVPILWVDGTGNLTAVLDLDDPALYAFAVYGFADPEAADGVAGEYIDAITPFIEGGDITQATLATGEYGPGYLTARAWGEALLECGYPCSGEDLQPILDTLSVDLSPMVANYDYDNSLHYPYADWNLFKVEQGGVYIPFNTYAADVP